MPDGIDLDVLFAETERRRLGEDFTFRHRNVHWQVEAAEAHDLRPQQHVTIEHPARARRLVPSPRITHGAGSRAWSARLHVADADEKKNAVVTFDPAKVTVVEMIDAMATLKYTATVAKP